MPNVLNIWLLIVVIYASNVEEVGAADVFWGDIKALGIKGTSAFWK